MKDKSWNEPTGKKNSAFDNSWKAPETTAFKNITPDSIPSSNYTYKGDAVSKQGDLPKSNYSYKGSDVKKSTNLPNKTYNYKGDKVGKSAK